LFFSAHREKLSPKTPPANKPTSKNEEKQPEAVTQPHEVTEGRKAYEWNRMGVTWRNIKDHFPALEIESWCETLPDSYQAWNHSVYKLITSPRPQDTAFGDFTQMLECGDVSCVSTTGFSHTSSKSVTHHCQLWTKSTAGAGRVLCFGTEQNWQGQDRKVS